MTTLNDQLFEFDINGFVVIPGAVSSQATEMLNQFWNKNLAEHFLHDVDFSWSPEWRSLIDCDSIFPMLDKLFSSSFRLDHMFCVDERFVSSGGKMHHHADMFADGVFYHVNNRKILSGLTGVMYALSDMSDATTHFCCIPGSHKANFDVPERYRDPLLNPLIHHVYLNEGDALVFSEALVHGTYPVVGTKQRRAIFARYTNAFSYYRRPFASEALAYMPPTPNYSKQTPAPIRGELLTPRQRSIVQLPAFARGRAPIGANVNSGV